MKKIILCSILCSILSLHAFTTKKELLELYEQNISLMHDKDKASLQVIKDKIVAGSISTVDLKKFWEKAQKKTIDQLRRMAIKVLHPSGRGRTPSDIQLGFTMIQKIMAIAKSRN